MADVNCEETCDLNQGVYNGKGIGDVYKKYADA